MSEYSEDEEHLGLLISAKNAALKPFHYATSKPARRAYIGAFLFFVTGASLLGLAAITYLFFYYAYVPVRGFSQPIYLQFDPGQNPYAIVPFRNSYLVSDQPYDVSVILVLPRTPANRAVGNFMVSLQLLGAGHTEEAPNILIQERRPAILTYRSLSLEYIYKAIALPLYLIGWRKESEGLTLPLLEGAVFGWRNTPSCARVELQSPTQMQIYSISISFRARLRGLRYLMYNFRITSFLFFTGMFWAIEMTIATAIWASLSYVVSGQTISPKTEPQEGLIKVEEKSEQPVADPTTSPGAPRIKEETPMESAVEIYPPATEADVEDEVDDFAAPIDVGGSKGWPSDSGIGTSMESSASRMEATRRRSMKNLKE